MKALRLGTKGLFFAGPMAEEIQRFRWIWGRQRSDRRRSDA